MAYFFQVETAEANKYNQVYHGDDLEAALQHWRTEMAAGHEYVMLEALREGQQRDG